jgi:hypothetical protein
MTVSNEDLDLLQFRGTQTGAPKRENETKESQPFSCANLTKS